MKFLSNKSQASLEYLQTYGWAILVLVVVGIAIWQLGILGPTTRINTASGFTVIKVLEPSIKYKSNTNINALTFQVMNAGGIRIKISPYPSTNITGDCSILVMKRGESIPGVSEETCINSLHGIPMAGACYIGGVTTIDPGDTWQAQTWCDSLRPGESFEVYITYSYEERGVGKETVSHKDTGFIRGYVE